MSLSSLHIDRFLCSCFIKESCIFFFNKQTIIKQSVANSVITVSGYYICAFCQRIYYIFWKLNQYVFLSGISSIYNFDTIHINNSIVIVRIFQINVFTFQILFDIYNSSCPDVFTTPLSFGSYLIFLCAKCGRTFFPFRIIKIILHPCISRLVGYVLSCPVTVFRSFSNCI